MLRGLVLGVLLCTLSLMSSAGMSATIGWVELVRLLPDGFEVQAKIDTGADNSSLDVDRWELFTRNGEQWVQFEIYNNGGDSMIMERPLKEFTRVKRKGAKSLRRPVVEIWLCIGDSKHFAKVNLANRDTYKYRMLIGRSFLKEGFLVDSSRKLTTSPTCASLD